MKLSNLSSRVFYLFLFITVSKSYSQIPVSQGYVILNSNDTIYGRIENSQLGPLNKCVLIINGTSSIQILKPEQVTGFFISPDFYFKTKQIDGKNTFLRLISGGKVSLYKGNMNLYISCSSDHLVLLGGGKENIIMSGKTFSTENTTYKTLIKNCVADTSYYRKIDKLFFDKNAIIGLIKEVNDQDFTALRYNDNKIFHKNQFSLDFGYLINTFQVQNLKYPNDSLYVSYGNRDAFGNGGNTKHRLNAWQIGFSYKRNIKSTNLYLYGGLQYRKLQKVSVDKVGFLHSTLTWESYGSIYFSDTIGNVKDQFQYNLTQVSMPVGLYQEISHNRVRPFYSIGISGNYYLKKSIVLNRSVFLNNVNVEEGEYKIDIPSFSMGSNLEIGCRYLINSNHSISAGLNWNFMKVKYSLINNAISRRIYFSFNF